MAKWEKKQNKSGGDKIPPKGLGLSEDLRQKEKKRVEDKRKEKKELEETRWVFG